MVAALGLARFGFADGFLGTPVQLTSSERFLKAGEAYFSPDGGRVVFQAVERPAAGEEADPFYAMFVADIVVDSGEGKNKTAMNWRLENVVRVSPLGTANTCGWFDPKDSNVLWFASTVEPPVASDAPGYQRGNGRYKWMFPPQMRIVRTALSNNDGTADSLEVMEGDGAAYVAECSVSSDGRYLLFCSLKSGQGDIFLRDLETGLLIALVTTPGYDGGPFFSPDGNRICYRSDRHNNNYLQLLVADLERDDTGAIIGVGREHQVTDNAHVNWCPFWHPDGEHLVFASSAMGHQNYEVFIIDAAEDSDSRPATSRYGTGQRRVTNADGADVLPAFNASGDLMMWTSQRDDGASSQLWIAPFILDDAGTSAQPHSK